MTPDFKSEFEDALSFFRRQGGPWRHFFWPPGPRNAAAFEAPRLTPGPRPGATSPLARAPRPWPGTPQKSSSWEIWPLSSENSKTPLRRGKRVRQLAETLLGSI
eukprot:gene20766-biopygen10135